MQGQNSSDQKHRRSRDEVAAEGNSSRLQRSGQRLTALLLLVIVALFSFALGQNSKNLNLPSWLQGSSEQVDLSPDLDDLYAKLKKNYDGQLESSKVDSSIKEGLVSITGDPYTTYLTQDEYSSFQDSLNGQFSGIGAELSQKNDQIVIVAPLDNSPAQKAGVKSGDIILKVNGESTTGRSVEDVITQIRGKAGTEVTLSLAKDTGVEDVTIVREEIKVDSVKHEILDGKNGKVGYIRISRFADDTQSLAVAAANDLKAQGIKKVILDLRSNGGGRVDAAVGVAGIWLSNKVVLSERAKGKEINVQRTATRTIFGSDVKTIVLMNEGTASASEIVAAALKDGEAATLLGKRTFGKGSVQTFVDLEDGAKLKVTIAHWFTPSGKTIDKEGISPDTEISNSGQIDQDEQKTKALEML